VLTHVVYMPYSYNGWTLKYLKDELKQNQTVNNAYQRPLAIL